MASSMLLFYVSGRSGLLKSFYSDMDILVLGNYGTIQSNMDVSDQTFWHLCTLPNIHVPKCFIAEISLCQKVPVSKYPNAEISLCRKVLVRKSSRAKYSYNSIKRTCSIKRPGLEYFKKSLLNVLYHHQIACRKQLNVLLY